MIQRTLHLSFALLALCLAASAPAAGIRVDLNPDNGRKDVMTPDRQNWQIKDGPSATQKFGEVTVTLRSAGSVGSGLTLPLWKGGLDSGATMTCDGVSVAGGDAGGQLEMVVSGLAPGKHTIVTFHNNIADKPMSKCTVSVDGKPIVTGLTPSMRVANDYDAASAYLEVDAQAGKDIVIGFKPDGSGGIDNVILNGFEIDTSDPTRKAIKPSPANKDEHVPEETVLTWTAPKAATAHKLYLGSSAQAVENATPSSPEFKGDFTSPKFQTKGLNSFDTYYWRVDAAQGDKVTKGDVWTFRVRHLAFPGAEGYGRFARGGRGGRVIEVTNLDDSGPGSLRAAVEAEGPRTVVFRVGGTIPLKDKLVLKNPYITIAGQTAPGDGICVRGATFGNLSTHDTIIRYIRTRVGDESGLTYDGMGFFYSDHCIIDHCSISWTIDEAVSSRGAKNITFQRNLIAQALNVAGQKKYEAGKGHSFAGSISGDIGSYHHNLLAHCAGRNWSLAGRFTQGRMFAGELDIRNNVVYNWERRTNDGGVRLLNLVGNYYIPGPASRVFHLLIAEIENPLPNDTQEYYVADNVMEGYPQYNPDNWKNGGVIGGKFPKDFTSMRLDKPFCVPYVTTQSAKEAYESVMADVGCNYPKYDSYDAMIIKDVLERKATGKGSRDQNPKPGIIDSQKDVGGWPELKGGEAPADADHDGMPDAWETANGLSPNDPADANGDRVGDGYTNLERYLNGIVANKPAAK